MATDCAEQSERRLNRRGRRRKTDGADTTSIYIDYPNASNCDLDSFGRAYDRYIVRVQQSSNLSPFDLTDIVGQLRSPITEQGSTSSNRSSSITSRAATEPLQWSSQEFRHRSYSQSNQSSPGSCQHRLTVHVPAIYEHRRAVAPATSASYDSDDESSPASSSGDSPHRVVIEQMRNRYRQKPPFHRKVS